MENNLDRLCRCLNYHFKNLDLLKQALTHCSASRANNERLEFLGDSILSFVIANTLFTQFPAYTEGQLSRLRAHLVKGETLAELALELNLGDYLYLGQGELKSGGFRRTSILADALEAVIAAIYLDANLSESKRVILHLYQSRLNDKALELNLKDAKTQLQEYLQAEKHALPEYTLTKIEGEEHNQVFFITCEVPKLAIKTYGRGTNRRKAEQQAAYRLLKQLQQST